MKKTAAFLLCLVTLSFFAGCASFRTAALQEWPSEEVAFDDELRGLYREAALAASGIRSIDGFADIWIKTPRRKARVFSSVQLRRPGDMRIIVSSGLLDWPVADMLFRTDSLFVHDLINNRMLVGSNTPENIEKVMGVRSGYKLLSEALTGLVESEHPPEAVRSVRRGGGKVSFTVATPSGSRVILVDQATRAVEGLAVLDDSGKKSIEIHFRKFVSYAFSGGTVRLPAEIDMLMFSPALDGAGRHEMVIVYDERDLEPKQWALDYRFPRNARLVELDKVGMLPWQ